MNISNHCSDLQKFGGDCENLKQFMLQHGLNGLELIQNSQWEEEIPSSMVTGLHMRFWPIWLDFWKENTEELIKQFGDKSAYSMYYGGDTKATLVEYYRNELKTAQQIGVKYVVFHVSHAQLEHCYNYQFNYTDEEVVEAFVEMINLVLYDFEPSFDILLENLWYPGFTLLDKKIATKLMKEIQYPNKGFMLDIGHLMNTNLELESEQAAVKYILEVLKVLGDASANIKGIHLNSSLSGKYAKEQIDSFNAKDHAGSFYDLYIKAFTHIGQIDTHVPFTHPLIQKVIEYVKPQYLVYEFMTNSIEELSGFIEAQNRALNM